MKLSPPKKNTFWIAVVLGVLGLIGHFEALPFISAYSFWFVVAGFALLLLGLLNKGI